MKYSIIKILFSNYTYEELEHLRVVMFEQYNSVSNEIRKGKKHIKNNKEEYNKTIILRDEIKQEYDEYLKSLVGKGKYHDSITLLFDLRTKLMIIEERLKNNPDENEKIKLLSERDEIIALIPSVEINADKSDAHLKEVIDSYDLIIKRLKEIKNDTIEESRHISKLKSENNSMFRVINAVTFKQECKKIRNRK